MATFITFIFLLCTAQLHSFVVKRELKVTESVGASLDGRDEELC